MAIFSMKFPLFIIKLYVLWKTTSLGLINNSYIEFLIISLLINLFSSSSKSSWLSWFSSNFSSLFSDLENFDKIFLIDELISLWLNNLEFLSLAWRYNWGTKYSSILICFKIFWTEIFFISFSNFLFNFSGLNFIRSKNFIL